MIPKLKKIQQKLARLERTIDKIEKIKLTVVVDNDRKTKQQKEQDTTVS